MNTQMSLFDIMPEEIEIASSGLLHVVHATFNEDKKENWRGLFEGYDELYGITFSSGIQFMENVMSMFSHVEMIFGCEGVVSNDIATIMAMEKKSVEQIAKSKAAKKMAERMETGTLIIHVSRDTKSHEKVFILKANDGRMRVITGSANMSASAFLGHQREDIVCFDDVKAYEHYKDRFDEFKEQCSDNVNQKVLVALNDNPDYLRDNIEEVPFIKTVDQKKTIIFEPDDSALEDVEIVADIKGFENEIKPMLPKQKKQETKIMINGDYTKAFKRKYNENNEVKKVKEKQLPKLHLDFETKQLSFNGKILNLEPEKEKIEKDIKCIENYLSSLSSFYGEWEQSQKDYYSFMNWYFASLFMPYLRYVGSKNNYDMTPFPVFGIIYGDSNGGKSTFIKLLSKLMCGKKISMNSSNDFTSSNIDNLKRACEGIPINIDDLAKSQYDNNYEKVIKDDFWGIAEAFVNYPAVAITTNKISSLKPDISKRTVTCHIGTKLEKEVGAKNSKKINDSMRQANNAFYCEYVKRMLVRVEKIVEGMKQDYEQENKAEIYFPDIFKASSITIKEIFEEYMEVIPDYVRVLTFSDYFGDKAVGKNAMKQIMTAWENDRKNFIIDKKKNVLTYSYADNSRSYELKYIQQELPLVLDAKVVGSNLVMKLDKAKEIFGVEFKKKIFG